MKTLSPAIDGLLRGRAMTAALLVQLDLPSGTQRLWSGLGTLTYNGFSWVSAGKLGRVVGAGETSEIRTVETTYELSGILDAGALNTFLSSPIRGSRVRAWLAFLNDNENVIPEPVLIDQSVIDVPNVVENEDGTSTLSIRCTSAIFDFRKPVGRFLTHEQLKRDFPGDTGFDRIPGLADRVVSWTQT